MLRDGWVEFERTGNVMDYLNYRQNRDETEQNRNVSVRENGTECNRNRDGSIVSPGW